MNREVSMNIIEVTGGKKYQREIAEKVVHFMMDRLLPRVRTLEINVEIKPLKGDAYGWCLMCDDKGKEFELEIRNNLPLKDFITTICHEMVHVKQYYRKEMDDTGMRWKKGKVAKKTDYLDLPWEKEAYRLQDKLGQMVWDENVV